MLVLFTGCRGPMAKIEAVRDALVADDPAAIKEATASPPKCEGGTTKTCLNEIANALGSKKGFVIDPPDHAAATTAAVILLREERGDLVGKVDMWLTAMKNETGVGHDALRLAVARKMAEAVPLISAKKIEDEAAARAAMKAIAAAIPGACTTYALLGANTDPHSIPAEHNADNSACVQKDLSRREGPGGRYGSGTFRALEGALSIWRETERALRMGLGHCDPGPRATIEKKLSLIEPATRKIETRKVESDSSGALNFMSDVHAEAGVGPLLIRVKDAGRD
jgi:hypothetical protein